MARIDAFLQMGREQGASDVHLIVGRPPLLRVDGDLTPIRYRDLTIEEADMIVQEILSAEQTGHFGEHGSVDLSYESPECGRFRMNVCRQARGLSVVCRVIPNDVIPLGDLGLPRFIHSLPLLNAGLVLVTGATGTGKTTTLAAVLNEVNEARSGSILTLEDPIEFVHKSKKCLVTQREIGTHVVDFASGLRTALRSDPDVILIGEMRDLETVSLALEASETGHLVLATLHTRGAVQTIDRILDAFPADAHNQIRNHLADNLKAVISQELVRSADGRGRRAAVEIMINTPAVAGLIREGKTFQMPSLLATNRKIGMQTMDLSLLQLVQAGEADGDHAFTLATDKRQFVPYVTNMSEAARLVGAGGATGAHVVGAR